MDQDGISTPAGKSVGKCDILYQSTIQQQWWLWDGFAHSITQYNDTDDTL